MAELYTPKQHIARPHKIWTFEDGTRIKPYTLVPVMDEDFRAKEIEIARKRTQGLITGRGDTLSAPEKLGFSILSDGVLNVCTWGGEYPSLLNQAVMTFTAENLEYMTKEDLNRFGTFCCWELEIAGHEAGAWRRYLFSSKGEADRKAYLEDRFRGVIPN